MFKVFSLEPEVRLKRIPNLVEFSRTLHISCIILITSLSFFSLVSLSFLFPLYKLLKVEKGAEAASPPKRLKVESVMMLHPRLYFSWHIPGAPWFDSGPQSDILCMYHQD